MTAENAVVPMDNGTPVSLDTAVKAVVHILRSEKPGDELLAAIDSGALPGEICLELAEMFDEFGIKVEDLDNLIEITLVLKQNGVISEATEQVLLLAMLEMAEQEEASATAAPDGKLSSDLAEVESTLTPAPTPESSLSAEQTAVARDQIIKAAAQILQEFGDNIPEEKLTEIRLPLTKETAVSIRQWIGPLILAQAELPESERYVDVTASLAVTNIILRERQAALTQAAFTAYETLVATGFRLRDRDEYGRPRMNVTSANLLRSKYHRWLDSKRSSLGEKELAAAEKILSILEQFIMHAGHESMQKSLKDDMLERDAQRLEHERERLIASRIIINDAINAELVARPPVTEEGATAQARRYLRSETAKLGSMLRTIGSKHLSEAEATLDNILRGYTKCALWQSEVSRLEQSGVDPKEPALSPNDKKLAVLEVERKELELIRLDLEERIEQSQGSKTSLKKLHGSLALVVRKLDHCDRLIAELASPVSNTVQASGIPATPVSTNIPPPPPTGGTSAATKGATYAQ